MNLDALASSRGEEKLEAKRKQPDFAECAVMEMKDWMIYEASELSVPCRETDTNSFDIPRTHSSVTDEGAVLLVQRLRLSGTILRQKRKKKYEGAPTS